MSVGPGATKTSRSAPPEAGLRFGSGHHAIRSEDAPLVTGAGKFTDDIDLPAQAHAAFVRSAVAHATIRTVDVASATKMPGVLAVVTGRDLAADSVGAIPPVASFTGRDGRPMFRAEMPVLAAERVRYVGEPIAIVIAETVHQAQDAAEAVEVDFDQLPAASDVARAMAPDAPAIWPDAPGNIALDWEDGDAAAVDAAFARAAHVERVRLVDTRLAPSAMEPRAAIASFDASSQRYTLIAPTQGVAVVRKILAEGVFKIPADRIRVVTHDVGGGFGMKVQAYAEYAALLCAARRVGRPVKWCASRLESFLDRHPRPRRAARRRAGARRGRQIPRPAGADLCRASAPIPRPSRRSSRPRTRRTACRASTSFPSIHIGVKMVLTDAAPLGPYRGAGRPEAIYLIERLIDRAAQRHDYRSRRAAPAQPDPAGRDALPDAERADLRQRRLCDHPGPGAGAGRLERLCGAPRRVRA